MSPQQVLDAAWAADRRRILARLVQTLGLDHVALAEDALQTAALRALHHWPAQGVPANAAGWLYTVARREAIDALRGASRLQPWPDDDADPVLPVRAPPAGRLAGEMDDDELALLFATCDPALPEAQQLALALRLMTGLDLRPLADVLLCSEAALAQRLARARTSLAGRPMVLPAGDALPPRRGAVLAVLALMFHSGMRARLRLQAGDEAAQAVALCWEAVRLARALAAHPITACGDADALAAMLLLHGARLTGTFDDDGQPLLLPGQARDRWDQGLVRLGLAHLQASQRAARLSRWHLLAGVAAEHAVAPRWEDTDWSTILRAYEALLIIDGSAVPRLAHAVARAEAGDAMGAYADLQALRPRLPAALAAHGLAALARAAERLGRREEAARWLDEAAQAARHPADARLLQARRAGLLC